MVKATEKLLVTNPHKHQSLSTRIIVSLPRLYVETSLENIKTKYIHNSGL